MALVIIGTGQDAVDLPAPSVYNVSQFDIDSEGTKRNEQGVMQRDRIRQGVYKVEMEWAAITSAQAVIIGTAISPATFSTTFKALSGDVTKTMYAGDKAFDLAQHADMATTDRWDVKLALIEV